MPTSNNSDRVHSHRSRELPDLRPITNGLLMLGLVALLLFAGEVFFTSSYLKADVPTDIAAEDKPADKAKAAAPDEKKDKTSPKEKEKIVLFDGKDLSGWQMKDGKEPNWKVQDGYFEVGSGNIETKMKFDVDFELHVEFWVPLMPEAKGQARGNSGIYLQGRYEVQVLDSFGIKELKDNDCGGIYEVAAPLKNACKKPETWQEYDITFHVPVCKDGKKEQPARVSVVHNGIQIHDDVKISVDNTKGVAKSDPCTPGPILLQDHRNKVRYRNIWIRLLSKE